MVLCAAFRDAHGDQVPAPGGLHRSISSSSSIRASSRSVGMSHEAVQSRPALVTVSSAMVFQLLTQLRISSCHQANQGSSREMSQLGDEARFKGQGRLWSVCGWPRYGCYAPVTPGVTPETD